MLKPFAALLLASTVASSSAVAATPMPALEVESLSARKLTLPADLQAGPCLFIIGFSKASRAQTSAWSRRIEGGVLSDSVSIYSVSVVEDVPRLMRGLVVNGIRSSVPERLHDRFLVVSRQSLEWKSLASYAEPDVAYLVLTNADHEIVWRTQGVVTELGLESLVEQVKAVAPAPPARQSVPADASGSRERP